MAAATTGSRWHPRLVVNSASMITWPLEREIELHRELGVTRVALLSRKIDAAGEDEAERLVRAAGLEIDSLMVGPLLDLARPEQWAEGRAALRRALARARRFGTTCAVITSGPAVGLTWEDAADAFVAAVAPVVAEARDGGMTIAVEHTNGLRFDLGFLHNLRDAIDVARRAGVAVCVEVNNVWGERALRETIAAGVDAIRTVQVNDFVVPTTATPDRAVPGDGHIPLARIVAYLEEAGYRGPYELEIVGPRIEAEGYPGAVRRSLEYFDRLLRG
ncbi:sugar phosphate isomerase/epimerase family protein [Parvibaculum sp.]|uniref:sugar phosphate isomerase/epimerase family protein n=1 Tax=Parvibaculum sp. TaxID=2024848 RepID=UPI003BA8E001